MHRIGLAAVLLSIGLFACAHTDRIEPISQVIDHPVPPLAQKLSVDEIGHVIIEAGLMRQWRFEPHGPGQMDATYDNGKHAATVRVTYNQKAYSITLVNSVNLLQEGNQIHRAYNIRVRNLEKDIEVRLATVATGAN
jgi:hypothetical protein